MAGFIGFVGLIALFCLIGSVLGWVAALRLSGLSTRVDRLERQLHETGGRAQVAARPGPGPAPAQPAPEPPRISTRPAARATPAATELPPAPKAPPAPPPPPSYEPNFFERMYDNMQRNWMAWLGGVCVALAGIFLVGYGIEMGYLGPTARIIAAVLAGIILHAAAEYLRRKTGSAEPAFAAMAGGATITLYAAIFAALELYDLLSPGTTFTLLAIVSIGTMALATVHGPLLAAIGILGAYFVPMFVPGYGGTTAVDLGYSLTVSAAALLLVRFVYRPWLWYGALAGTLGWWLFSLGQTDADGWRGYYLAAFAYLALAVPTSDWLLKRRPKDTDPANEVLDASLGTPVQTILVTVVLLALAQAASIAHFGFTNLWQALALWSPLSIIVLIALRARESLRFAPWILLATQMVAWWLAGLDLWTSTTLDRSVVFDFIAFSLVMSAIFSVGCHLVRRGKPFSHLHESLIWLAPVLWMTLAYRITTDFTLSWQWAIAAALLGLAYLGLAGQRLLRDDEDASSLWLILGGHLAYSLAAVMLFREATLTLALAVQVVSLAWLDRRFGLPALGWLIKGVLAVVVARLTFNPWIASYASGVHWSLWTYGGATLCCFVAARLAGEGREIRKWLEAATLHLLVLFLGAETRYWLYDGQIFIDEFTLTEAAIDAALWGGLALSYYQRALASRSIAPFYTICSRILFVLAMLSYLASLTKLNPLMGEEQVASTPIWNILLLAYGAPVLIATATYFFYDARFRGFAAAFAGAALFIFVSFEIRHLWHGALDLDLGMLNGEIYTYSAAWLAMAVATMLSATRLGSAYGYRAGIGLLCLVIAKIFLYDMAGLEGLLRVASFMGLGLALLGLAWLYQRTAGGVGDGD